MLMTLNFLNFLNGRHPNIKFIIEKQINHSIAFLDVFRVSKSHTSNTSQMDLYRASLKF